MTTKIEITANGNADGDEFYIPHDDWHSFLFEFASKRYPGAEVLVTGEPNTDGGNVAYITTIDDAGDEDAEEIDIINDAFEAASDVEELWVPHSKG